MEERPPRPLPSVLRKIEKWGDYEAVGGLVPVRGGRGVCSNEDTTDKGPDGLAEKVGQAY